jgi:hypothetical protein
LEINNNYFTICFAKKKSFIVGRSKNADICDKNDKTISKINSELWFDGGIFLIIKSV